ncbi:hypothetical protein [Couchioplanes caeruleus]|uniref:PPE family domain-containing protein n=1 Tax=Couchioplanes caeruleus TaxID=56438 RepID=A0A3N1GNZ8_9ACTN|nr:hypothetical protein [Couchioplanes caeruleus]ROP31931.1 hypothetical protein EDD30_4858 [Couchioplanes caeruleus]
MLIAGGGGGYGGTDWNSKDVRTMWAAVANQQTDSHFDVVSGWKQTAELTLTHLGQVKMYRDNLASVWPPSKSPASAAYLERLDNLIADLQATHEAASANYTTFSTVTLTLSLARHKLQPLFEQYEANERANLSWQAKQQAEAADPAEPPKISFPPVSAAQQEQLNTQARAIMYDLSSTVISGQAALQKPKPYNPAEYSRYVTGGDDQEYSNSGLAVPPVIPSPEGASGRSASNPTNSSMPSSPSNSSLPGVTNPGGAGIIGSGPTLGSMSPTTANLPQSPTHGTTGAGNLIPPATGTSASFHPSAITAPGATNPLFSGGIPPRGERLTEPGGSRTGGSGPAGRMTMPPGGIIGAGPGNGVIGQMPANIPGSRTSVGGRVNPVGGVISPQGASPVGGTPARPASTPHAVGGLIQPLTGTREHSERPSTKRWDPDNPWATDEGVDPVLLPPADPSPIDPGPAIGYRA